MPGVRLGWVAEGGEEAVCRAGHTLCSYQEEGPGYECTVGLGACKELVLAASWGTGLNCLHCRPGWTPTDIS